MERVDDLRAYINPQPGFSEAEQKMALAALRIRALYVQTRRGEDRTKWIESLRRTSVAVVAELYVLARATGRKDKRVADLLLAKDDVHAAGSYILEASTGLRSNVHRQWKEMLKRAETMLAKAVKRGKRGRRKYDYTDGEMTTMRAIADSKRLRNWNERKAELARVGIKPPGRTWFYNFVVSTLTTMS